MAAIFKPICKKTNDKEYWQFGLVLELDGLALKSPGWRYWPNSGKVLPPQMQHRGSGRWYNAFKEFSGEHQDVARKAIMKYIDRGVQELTEEPELEILSYEQFVAAYDADEPLKDVMRRCREAFKAYYTKLAEDRGAWGPTQWQAHLEHVAEEITAGATTTSELTWRLDNGVYTAAEVEWIINAVKGEGRVPE